MRCHPSPDSPIFLYLYHILTSNIWNTVTACIIALPLPLPDLLQRYHSVKSIPAPHPFSQPHAAILPRLCTHMLEPVQPWAVVTGASDGIGKEFCLQLARMGFNICLVSRTPTKLKAVEALVKVPSPHTSLLSALCQKMHPPSFPPPNSAFLSFSSAAHVLLYSVLFVRTRMQNQKPLLRVSPRLTS